MPRRRCTTSAGTVSLRRPAVDCRLRVCVCRPRAPGARAIASPRLLAVRTHRPTASATAMAAWYSGSQIVVGNSMSRPSTVSSQRSHHVVPRWLVRRSKSGCCPSDKNTGRGVRSPRPGIQSRRPAVCTSAQMAPSRARAASSGCMTPPRRRRCVSQSHSHWNTVASDRPRSPNDSYSQGVSCCAACSTSAVRGARVALPMRSRLRPRWLR